MSALLRQPGSFEAVLKIGASAELFEPDEFSIAELPRQEEGVADPIVTAWHRPRNTTLSDDLVAPVVDSVDLLIRVGKDLPLLLHYGGDFVVPSPSAGLNGGGSIYVLARRNDQGEDAFDVLTIPRSQQAADDLDVLLRHCPRSIPQPESTAS